MGQEVLCLWQSQESDLPAEGSDCENSLLPKVLAKMEKDRKVVTWLCELREQNANKLFSC